MIFKPFGVNTDELIDPFDLAREFQEAMRVAQQTTQFQWQKDLFTDVNRLERGQHVKIYTSDQEGHLYRKPYDPGTYTAVGNDPDLSSPDAPAPLDGADDLYHIPYNRGWDAVSNVGVNWTSSYPELCFFIFSFQFIRKQQSEFHETNPSYLVVPRVQLRISLDNGVLPGTGPMAFRSKSEARGMGYARRSMSQTIVGMTLLPAGAHNAGVFAAQVECDVYTKDSRHDTMGFSTGSSAPLSELFAIEQSQYLEYPPSTGVCIGNRRLIAITFPRGAELKG